MKKISFATMKGGTGKTTLSYNISASLAHAGYKVLVVDVDFQCNISANFGIDIFDVNVLSVACILEDMDTDPYSIIVPAPISQISTLDIIPSTKFLYGTELMLASKTMRELMFVNYIKKNEKVFNYYDYIFFDCGPNFGLANQNAFFCSDSIILSVDPSVNSSKGTELFLDLWQDAIKNTGMKNNVNGLVINNVERTKITSSLMNYINTHPMLSKIQFENTIPHTTRFKECEDQNLPIFLLKTKSRKDENSKLRAVDALNSLINEMIEKGVL